MTGLGLVALAAVGAVTRWWLANLLNRAIPLGTLLVNLVGAFVLGLLAQQSGDVMTTVGVGLLGSLTTFSTLMLECVDPRRSQATAAGYLVVTVVGGIAAAALGLELS